MLLNRYPLSFLISECGTGYTSGHSTPRTYGIAELTQSNGIDWGGMSVSTGTDCSTPGVGTAANTHSSRSGFYEVRRLVPKKFKSALYSSVLCTMH